MEEQKETVTSQEVTEEAVFAEAVAKFTGEKPEPVEEPSPDDVADLPDEGEAAAEAAAPETEDEPEGEEPQDGEPEGESDAPDESEAAKDLQAEVERLTHLWKSEQGRRQALERERPTDPPKPRELPDDLKKVAEEYPEMAEPFVAAITDLQARIEALGANVGQVSTSVAEGKEVELERLSPGWRGKLSENWNQFDAYLNHDAPVWVAEAYRQNAQGIVDPAAAAQVIAAFDEFRGASQSAEPETADQKLAGRRALQKRGARSPDTRSKPAAVASSDADVEAQAMKWASKRYGAQ